MAAALPHSEIIGDRRCLGVRETTEIRRSVESMEATLSHSEMIG